MRRRRRHSQRLERRLFDTDLGVLFKKARPAFRLSGNPDRILFGPSAPGSESASTMPMRIFSSCNPFLQGGSEFVDDQRSPARGRPGGSPGELDKFIRAEYAKWSGVAKQAGVKGE